MFVGLDEAAALWGAAVRAPADVRALLPSPRVVVVKDAARRRHGLPPGGAVHVPALRVEVVEPVGAGDAFAAGFLAALLGGGDAVRCLRSGHLTAASALTVTGDHGPPARRGDPRAPADGRRSRLGNSHGVRARTGLTEAASSHSAHDRLSSPR